MVIDMKREYNNKTKDQLAFILINDIIQNQTDRINVLELLRRINRIKFTLNIEENEDSNYSKRNNNFKEIKEVVQKDDEDSKNEESLKNSIFLQLKDSIIR